MDTLRQNENILPGWYKASREVLLAVRALLSGSDGFFVPALLVEGPAGCGKTSLAEALAEGLGGGYVYHLCHSWSDDQEFFRGVNIPAVVKGDASAVEEPGVLARAVEASHDAARRGTRAVLCIDEIDKVQERTENLLLDFLQTGRVPVRPGEHIVADPDGLVVILTSNGARPLGEPLLRRVRRLRMRGLSDGELLDLVKGPRAVVAAAISLFRAAETEQAVVLSLQELRRLLSDLSLCATFEDCGWAVLMNFGRDAEWRPSPQLVSRLRGELQAARRRGEL
jgi:replication-associated recombination protein RarA